MCKCYNATADIGRVTGQQRPRIRLHLHHGGACCPKLHFIARCAFRELPDTVSYDWSSTPIQALDYYPYRGLRMYIEYSIGLLTHTSVFADGGLYCSTNRRIAAGCKPMNFFVGARRNKCFDRRTP
jgi:hypothetical protein